MKPFILLLPDPWVAKIYVGIRKIESVTNAPNKSTSTSVLSYCPGHLLDDPASSGNRIWEVDIAVRK